MSNKHKPPMKIENLLIRSSQIGNIMPAENPKVAFTETHIEHLVQVYNSSFYARYEEINSKYFEKGNEREEDAITLLSLYMKRNFRKNKERKNNDYITGEWDLDDGKEKIEETTDIKNSWSKNTFDKTRVKKMNMVYFYQGQCYMWLTGALRHTLAYCLVNGTYTLINDEIRRLGWKMGVLDASIESNPVFIEKVKQIERNHIFDIDGFMKENPGFEPKSDVLFDGEKYTWDYDVPAHQRVFKYTFERDERVIEKMKARVIESRNWINANLIMTLKNI